MNRLRSDCMVCLLKNVSDVPASASESEKIAYMQQVLHILAEAPLSISAPVLVWKINQLKQKMFGIKNPFASLKHHFNEFVLSYEPAMREQISSAPDELLAAIQYALVGNYIDFGAMEHVEEDYLMNLLTGAHEIQLDPNQYLHLTQDLSHAQKLLVLTDNCGEIVADKLLIQTIQKLYPHLDITVMVRGEPVLNDATIEDARQVGLTDSVAVIGNGNGVAGTCLELLSPEAARTMDEAQVILSKGQGNFETLRCCGRNVYYLFLCKCDMFARQFHVPKLTGILINDRDCSPS